MESSAKVTSKGQITLPAEIRRELCIRSGDRIGFRKNSEGRYELVPKTHTFADLRGALKTDRPVSGEDIDRWIAEAREARGRKAFP